MTLDMYGLFDIKNKSLVFYRVIYNKPLEVIKIIYYPKDANDDIRREIRKTRYSLENMTELIPEFMDLQKIVSLPKDKKITMEEYQEARRKMNSFVVHIALWDGSKVETMHLFEYHLLFKELFDMSRLEEVETELNKLLKKNLK